MTKSDFVDWKRHAVTQEVFSRLEGRIQELLDTLVANAGLAPEVDARNAGGIQAYRDLLSIEWGEDE